MMKKKAMAYWSAVCPGCNIGRKYPESFIGKRVIEHWKTPGNGPCLQPLDWSFAIAQYCHVFFKLRIPGRTKVEQTGFDKNKVNNLLRKLRKRLKNYNPKVNS